MSEGYDEVEGKYLALRWVETLRNGTALYEMYIQHLTYDLQAYGLTLESIGTSQAEFAVFRRLGCMVLANECLIRLRTADYPFRELAFECFVSQIRKGQLALKEIGTDMNEVKAYIEEFHVRASSLGIEQVHAT